MSITGKMHIDGFVEGTIASLDSLSIGRHGEVRGQIKAHSITVTGLLEGEIHCQSMTIENGGRVRGMVYSQEMVVARKGCFVGERLLVEETTPPAADAATEGLSRLLEELPSLGESKPGR